MYVYVDANLRTCMCMSMCVCVCVRVRVHVRVCLFSDSGSCKTVPELSTALFVVWWVFLSYGSQPSSTHGRNLPDIVLGNFALAPLWSCRSKCGEFLWRETAMKTITPYVTHSWSNFIMKTNHHLYENDD